MNIMNNLTKTHLENIRTALAEDNGIRIADLYNKLALETKAIDLDTYRKAASIIVEARLAQI